MRLSHCIKLCIKFILPAALLGSLLAYVFHKLKYY